MPGRGPFASMETPCVVALRIRSRPTVTGSCRTRYGEWKRVPLVHSWEFPFSTPSLCGCTCRLPIRAAHRTGEDQVMTESDAAGPLSGHTAWARNLQTPLRTFLRTETGSAAVLLIAALAALAWVNLDARSYESVWSTALS